MDNALNVLNALASLVIIASFLFFAYTPYLFKPFRYKKMEMLAKELGLTYKRSEPKVRERWFRSVPKRENIIWGKYKGKDVYLYDVTSTSLEAAFSAVITRRFTVINKKNYKSYGLPYFSVKKIKKVLNGHDPYPEYTSFRPFKVYLLLIAVYIILYLAIQGFELKNLLALFH